MKLRDLIDGLPATVVADECCGDREITGITKDSREVREGFLFFATDSSRAFLQDALQKGASAVVSEEKRDGNVPCLVTTENARRLLALAAAKFYGFPSRRLRVAGITGTNGKTTITYLMESIVRAAGAKAGVIGTISYRYNNHVAKASNTTPESAQIQSLLADMKKENVDWAVMEVSSHALDQGRVEGIDFDCAIFTNLTHDHLDYHGTFEQYRQAKQLLFHRCLKESAKERKWALINLDDPSAPALIPPPPITTLTYSARTSADAHPLSLHESIDGLALEISVKGEKVSATTPLVGLFNVSNILAAALFGYVAGFPPDVVGAGISSLKGVPGRLERVATNRNFHVFVDYAHTPDALEKTMETLNRVRPGRLILAFGCGGDRDRTKRPVMGKIAAQLADFTIVTSDNPRTEEPRAIIGEITRGMNGNSFKVVEDRKTAIAEALGMAREKDTVLVAGKGHEDYQIIGKTAYPFSDRAAIEEYLNVAR